MKPTIAFVFLLAVLSCSSKSKSDDSGGTTPTSPVVTPTDSFSYWITDPTNNVLFQERRGSEQTANTNAGTITIDPATTYQSVDGFGYALTGGSAQHLAAMSTSARQTLLTNLFDSTNGIGVSYLRISIGASDLDASVFSYDDLPSGVTSDNDLKYFSIAEDQKTLIPILKQILQINPNIKILASPWSAPVWMKDNGNSVGGSLKTDCYNVYAQYFVKYIQAMKAEGINIDAITIQNEPLNPANNPSMYMPADQQLSFVKTALGPVFKANNISSKIIIYDHNADNTDYATSILSDADAAQYIDGSAFHLYAGSIDALGPVHDAYPQKNLYFTEQWVGAPGDLSADLIWHTENVIIGSMRNWCKTALEWNLSSNPTLTPHTTGGCDQCLGAVTINGDNVTRNSAYYIIAHAAKQVRPGSVRIATNTVSNLPNVAFKRADGKIVLIVLNKNSGTTTFNVTYNNKTFSTSLNSGAVETIVL